MTGSNDLPPTLSAALAASLEVLAKGCGHLVEDQALLQRLTQMASEVRREAPPAPRSSLSVNRALSLTRAARGMLAALAENGSSGEATSGLSHALADLSSQLGAALRRQQAHRVRGLYVIIDPQVTGGRAPLDIARAAVAGGARMLQLRDKLRDKGQSLPLAQELARLCQASDVLLIINDHVDLAVAVEAGGVHVGQTDLPVAQARRTLAPHQVLGRSNREFDQLVESQELGADHLAFGPIYTTSTKSTGRQPQGPERLRQARNLTSLPLVAIGGINAENVAPVVEAGADAICVTAAVGAAADPEAAARRLVEAIDRAGGRT
jgi:thiamine-phosphate diphosphorylase